MMSNREIGRLFSLYAELLLLHRTNERLSALLSGASYRLRNMADEVISLPKKELGKLFRPELVRMIEELKGSSNIEKLNELIQLTPSGLFDMMRIRGLGGKKLSILWHQAKIDTVDSLLEACKNDELSKIPGFGKKTQENIVAAIESFRSSNERFHFAFVFDDAMTLQDKLQKHFRTKMLSLCGEVRRQSTTVAEIEIVAAITAKTFKTKIPRKLMVVQSSSAGETRGHTLDEIPVVVYHVSKEKFYLELFTRTGSEAHVKKILKKSKGNSYTSEEEIYQRSRTKFVVPELREDHAEWDFIKKNKELVSLADIKGVVHNHTTWSDGVDSLGDFVNACRKLKYEYVVISDHSKNAHYAGGLNEDKLLKQMEEIDKLNKKMKPFKIFKSVECDILVSGELDYSNELLKKLDMVIISVHQLLKMDEQKATKRLIKAIENPYTTILGHMTGRQLLIRPGYPVNFKKVIDACAANKVVIEINANPYRLDMDWGHIPYAMKKGVMISVNPDAHSIDEIHNIRWGVSAGRKGGLTKEMTWNAMGVRGVEKWLRDN